MDLCLKGSQINLATRQKPKPKLSSQGFLAKPQRHLLRPHSANFSDRRFQSSPFGCRPQSADPKFGRRLPSASGSSATATDSDYSSLNLSKKQLQKFQSVSSSNLYKLLLEEPIKRSWLCKDSSTTINTTHSDGSSELSSYRRSGSLSNISSLLSSGRVVRNDRFMSSLKNPTRSISSSSAAVKSKNADFNFGSSQSLQPGSNGVAEKPDLPGRVSFSKPQLQLQQPSDNDSSDYESPPNYYEAPIIRHDNISAPGPVKPEDYSFANSKTSSATTTTTLLSKELSSHSLKKSVHFGASGNNEDVIAETFEYPKCPSENCSCSTRSSSSGSLSDTLVPNSKCYCNSPSCKYYSPVANSKSMESETLTKQDMSKYYKETMEISHTAIPPLQLSEDSGSAQQSRMHHDFANASHKLSRDLREPEESQVIRDYKNAVGEQLENSVVKNLLDDSKTPAISANATTTTSSNLNNFELPSYLSKYSQPLQTKEPLDKPNNIRESNNSLSSSYKTDLAKKDLLKMDNKLETSLHTSSNPKSSSESVINNYLKVAASTTSIIKKKENNFETDVNKTSGSSQATNKNVLSTKSKTKTAPLTQNNIKKAKSFGNLREERNLHEFNLDKIDSWMSMHEQAMADGGGDSGPSKTTPALSKHASLDESFEKFTQETMEAMQAMDAHDMEDAEDNAEDMDNNSQKSQDEQSQDDSTYEEIVSVIKEIEEDKKKDNYAERLGSEMDLKLGSTPSVCTPHPPAESMVVREKSPDKYRDILSYLDNVEDSCEKTLLETRRSMPDTNRTEVEFVVEPDIAEDVPKLSDLLMLPNHQLARRVIALSLRANELANAVHLSKEHVIKVRTEKQKTLRAEKCNSANRMKEQKKHYEAIVKRHQGFIEQLLKDKGSLCEKVAALTRRLESQNQAWEHKLETEITRVKENTMAGEKIRRERWVRENTKKIKELTVKGLEAEINKMTCNHQREITELKRTHQQQLLDALEDARIKHEQIENSIRESCAQDREAIISKERNAIRERFDRQLEEERQSFDEQKQKLIEEHQQEKERLQNQLRHKDSDLQTKRAEWQKEKELEMQQAITELQDKMSKQEEKFLNRINTIEKQYEADFEIWKNEYENNCKVQAVEKENTIRQHYRAERDRQIDVIVQRMDAEALKNNEEYENKMSRLKEKYDKDLQELERVEKSLREKYADTRTKLAESDAQLRNFQAEKKQLQMELDHSKKMCSEFLMERDQLRENLRHEIQTEVQSLKAERDQEIQQIHKRVQQAIEKKDSTIDILQKENGTLRERCLKLEAVIRQQRKDYCVK